MSFLLAISVFLSIAIILAVSLNLIMGYGGMVSIAHGAMMGVGGYTAAVISIRTGINILWAYPIGALAAALIGGLFMLATARLGMDEFILASFAFQMVLIEAISRWTAVTNGTRGLSGVPRPAVLGTPLVALPHYATFASLIALIAVVLFVVVGRSPFGLALRAMRESEAGVKSVGKNPVRLKVTAFALGSAFAGIAGGLMASMITFIHPDNFSVFLSIVAIAYLLIGGLGNMYGAIVGALFLISLPEIIKSFEFVPSNLMGPVQQITYGLVLMLFVWFRPEGILPEKPIIAARHLVERRSAADQKVELSA